MVYIRTGWGDYWQDPDTDKVYYTKAPGLSYDAAKYLGDKRIVAIGARHAVHRPGARGHARRARPAPRPACPRACRSRCTTTC